MTSNEGALVTADDSALAPWNPTPPRPDEPGGGPEYVRLLAQFRRLQDLLAGCALPPSLESEIAAKFEQLGDQLEPFQVAERDRTDGRRPELPGRGSPLIPPLIVDSIEPGAIRGRITFGRIHLGGRSALHGGVAPLLFDDLLGRLVGFEAASPLRTAFLHTDYRKVTPIGVELRLEGDVDKTEGRKTWTSGRILNHEGDTLVEASALFVRLLPGQP
jgi:hypothetical protein